MCPEISLQELHDNLEVKTLVYHSDEVQGTIDKFLNRPSFNTPDGILLRSITNAMPGDAIEETYWTFERSSTKTPNLPERYLVVAATTTLFNLLDNYAESDPDTNAANIASEDLLLPNGVTTTITDIVKTLDKWVHQNIDPNIPYAEIVEGMIAAQITFSKLPLNKNLDNALAYRAQTLGQYAILLSRLSKNSHILNKLAEVQFDDDFEDVEEDRSVQLTPFTAFQAKHSITDTETIFGVLQRVIGIQTVKKLIRQYEKSGKFTSPLYLERYRLWFENADYFSEGQPATTQVYYLLKDWAQIVDFYLNKKMQLT